MTRTRQMAGRLAVGGVIGGVEGVLGTDQRYYVSEPPHYRHHWRRRHHHHH